MTLYTDNTDVDVDDYYDTMSSVDVDVDDYYDAKSSRNGGNLFLNERRIWGGKNVESVGFFLKRYIRRKYDKFKIFLGISRILLNKYRVV